MNSILKERVYTALKALGIEGIEPVIEFPADLAHGDYATNAAMVAFSSIAKSARSKGGDVHVEEFDWRIVKKDGGRPKFSNPRDLAAKIVQELGNIEGVEKIGIAGPGFINFTLSREYVARTIQEVTEDYGRGTFRAGKRIVVEYSCPNPFKEMHIGHLMSTVIGESVSRLVEFSGASTVRDSYGGDVGPHVAKALWGLHEQHLEGELTAENIGAAYAYGSAQYEEHEEAKRAIDELNVAIYRGDDANLMQLWRQGKEVSVDAFKELYKKLGTHFDRFFFESETAPIGLSKVEEGIARGVFEKSEGAVIYPGEKKGLHTLVFVTSRGTPTYEAKELGLAFLKEQEFPCDESYILTAAEQVGHFKVVKAALEDIAPDLAAKTHHIPHGFLRLPEGKMSSRKGNVITAEALIATAVSRVAERNPDEAVADMVGVGAVKYAILRAKPGSDVVFDIEQALSVEGDSGPYLQYSYVRAVSVLEKAGDTQGASSVPQQVSLLERLLVRFPAIVERAAREFEPHYVTTYLTELASAFNSWYAAEKIIGSEHEAYKLALTKAFAITMKNGLWLLGITAPERM